MRKTIFRVLFLLCLAVFVFSGVQVYRILNEYNEADEHYTALEQYVTVSRPAPVPSTTEPTHTTETAPETEEVPEVSTAPTVTVDFEALSQINPDTVAWLIIEGTPINYPVVQGSDNEYYLKRQFDGRYNTAGCLFLDAGNDSALQDRNSVIYGHYMNSGAMFSALSGYKTQAFYDDHPTALLITPEATYTVRFFSGYVSDTASAAWSLEFADGEYSRWLDSLTRKSRFIPEVFPTAQDRVLTLSTCSYEFENARFVLHGVLEELPSTP